MELRGDGSHVFTSTRSGPVDGRYTVADGRLTLTTDGSPGASSGSRGVEGLVHLQPVVVVTAALLPRNGGQRLTAIRQTLAR